MVAGYRIAPDELGNANYKKNVMIFRLDDELNLLSYMEWTLGELSTYSSYATDIAVTDDGGGIFVTGSITGWSEGGFDIFVMKATIL